VVGGAATWGALHVRASQERATLASRVKTLEADAAQLQAERERLHAQLEGIVKERKEMATTAERLRAQVDEQLQRLEGLAAELAPPADERPGGSGGEADDAPGDAPR